MIYNFTKLLKYSLFLTLTFVVISFSQQNIEELRRELQFRPLYSTVVNQYGEIFAGTWGAGIWKSTDEGISWFRVSEGLESYDIRKLFLDSNNKLFAITGLGIYSFDNSSQYWQIISNLPKNNAYRNIIQVDNDLILVDDNGIVYKSQDGGKNWQKVSTLPEKILIAPITSLNKKIIVGTEKGLYESYDKGSSWIKINNFISGENITDIKNYNNTLYFTTFNNGIFISKDGGTTITALNDGLGTKKIKFITTDINGKVFLSTYDNGLYILDEERDVWKKTNFDYSIRSAEFISFKKNNIIAGSSSGSVFKSTDGGINWIELPKKLIVARPNDRYMYVKASDEIQRYYLPPPIEFYKNKQNKTNAATIIVTYTGFSAEAQAAFQYAIDIWASLITSSVPIRVNATYTSLGSGILGSAGPSTSYTGFSNQPYANTWYPVALAEKINGDRLNLNTNPDINANFNSDFSNWYFGTDGNTPFTKYDFVSVVLHELCHGLGYVGSFSYSGGVGSWGDPTYHYPYIFDRFIYNGSSQLLINTGIFFNPSTDLGNQLTGNNLWWNGPNTGTARLYAPAAWSGGSSIYHLDESTYPPGSGNNLMTYALANGEAIHSPGSIVLNQMADMGWSTSSPVTYSISGTIKDGSNNPISGVTVTLSGSSSGSTTTNSSGVFTFSNLSAGGSYTLTPSKTNYSFSPSSRNYTNLSANQTTANFTATPLAAISVNPTSLSYGDVKTSQYSDKTITITNSGLANLIINSFTFSGTDTSSFHLVSPPTLPLTITPSSNQVITIRFSPVSIGSKSANLIISYGGAGATLNVPLSGNGIASSSVWSQNKTTINFDSLGFLSTPSDSLLLITNTSLTDSLVITSVVYTGGNNKFSLNETLPIKVSPNSSKNIKIRFNPDSVGTFSGTITFNNNSGNQPTANLNVTGKVFGSIIAANKTTINFGVVGIGSGNKDSTIEITNTGSYKLKIFSVGLATADSSFEITTTLPSSGVILNPSEKYYITIRLKPNILGVKTGTITINNNSKNNTSFTITVSANVQQSYLTFTPSSINFDSTFIGQVSKTLNLIIHNSSTLLKQSSFNKTNVTVTLFDKVITGDTVSFKILNKKTNVSLQSGANDTVQILFYPHTAGIKNATLTITSNDLTPIRTINLTGFGGGKAVISTNYSSINLGDCVAGKYKDTTLIITNTGNLDLILSSFSFTGSDNSSFGFIINNSPKTLLFNQSDTVKFRFNASLPGGNKSAQLSINSNDPSLSILNIPIIANVKYASLYKYVSTIQYNTTDIGGKSDTEIVIKNNGNSNLEIGNIYLDGAFYTDFILGANYNNIVLAPNEEKNIKVSFIPSDTGLRYARLVITSNDQNKPEDYIILKGTGKTASLPSLYLAYNIIDFGYVNTGFYKDTIISIKNNGNAPLVIDSLNIIGTNKNRFSIIGKSVPFTLLAGESDNIVIRYQSSLSQANAILRIKSNDLQKPIFEILLNGNSSFPIMTLSDSAFNFNKVNVKDSSIKTLKIRNNGLSTLIVDSVSLINADGFFVNYIPLPIQIQPAEEKIIVIKFSPNEPKNYSSVLKLKTNDPNIPEKLIPLFGLGAAPNMILSQKVDFGKVMKDNIKYSGFRIGNSGNAILTISGITVTGNNASEFEIINKTYPYNIAEGQSDSVTVKFTAKTIGVKDAKIKVLSNDITSNNEIVILAEATTNVQVNDKNEIPLSYELKQNYPNPFNPSTRIYYAIKENGFVSLKLFDIYGREVEELVNEYKPAGTYSIDFIPKDLTSGVYFYILKVNNFSQTRKMMFIK